MKISTFVLILFGICCAQLISAAQEDTTHIRKENPHRQFVGLEISYKPDVSNPTPEQLQHQLLLLIRKCWDDSMSFVELLNSVKDFNQSSGRNLKLHAEMESSQFLLTPIAFDEFKIDLGDLQVLPNPIRDDKWNFSSITGTPSWAGTVCSFLGHEIAEHLAQTKAGKRDRDAHHDDIANKMEDRIVKDYYGVKRTRGEDCRKQHGNHPDILIEIKDHGIERLHLTAPRVSFNGGGEASGQTDPGRLAYISYEEGA